MGAYFIEQPIPDRGHIWMPRVVNPILKAPVFLVCKGYVCILVTKDQPVTSAVLKRIVFSPSIPCRQSYF
jgi:hypothetical protein